MCVDDIKLPNYKLRHELCNSITHGLGAIFGILATIFMYLKICGVFPQSEVVYDIDFIYRCIGVGIYGFLDIRHCLNQPFISHGKSNAHSRKGTGF